MGCQRSYDVIIFISVSATRITLLPFVRYTHRERIDQFIDLNKALTLRMFGDGPPSDVITGPPSDVITGGTAPDNAADIQSFRTVQETDYPSKQASNSKI